MRPLSAVLLLLITAVSARLAQAQDVAETEPEIERQAESPPPPPPDVLLLITVNVPGANIVVDESQSVAAPASALRLSPGSHTVQVSAEGYRVFEQSIQVPSEGARVDVFLDPSVALAARLVVGDTNESNESSGVHKQWWFWAAIGGGVVVVAGVIAAIALASGGDGGQEVIPVPPIPGGP
ncbi:MAG: hypothetical protein ACI9KE_002628 [Polyangiales bacterium]|jgi:hypothetical protein